MIFFSKFSKSNFVCLNKSIFSIEKDQSSLENETRKYKSKIFLKSFLIMSLNIAGNIIRRYLKNIALGILIYINILQYYFLFFNNFVLSTVTEDVKIESF